jgi:hypothetical protein
MSALPGTSRSWNPSANRPARPRAYADGGGRASVRGKGSPPPRTTRISACVKLSSPGTKPISACLKPPSPRTEGITPCVNFVCADNNPLCHCTNRFMPAPKWSVSAQNRFMPAQIFFVHDTTFSAPGEKSFTPAKKSLRRAVKRFVRAETSFIHAEMCFMHGEKKFMHAVKNVTLCAMCFSAVADRLCPAATRFVSAQECPLYRPTPAGRAVKRAAHARDRLTPRETRWRKAIAARRQRLNFACAPGAALAPRRGGARGRRRAAATPRARRVPLRARTRSETT